MNCVSWTVCQTLKNRLFVRFLKTVLCKERVSYDLENWFRKVLVICFITQWAKRSKHGLRFPAKENPNMEKALFDLPIVLQYEVKAKHRLVSRNFSGMKFFHPSVRLTNQKPRARFYPFDKHIKSPYFRSFVVSVLFALFHFKVIRKSF